MTVLVAICIHSFSCINVTEYEVKEKRGTFLSFGAKLPINEKMVHNVTWQVTSHNKICNNLFT